MAKRKPTYTPMPQVPQEVMQRLALMLEVLGGKRTVTDAARSLGTSRNHFQTLMHRGLRARFGKPLPREPFPTAWLALVQRLVTDDLVPEGVSPEIWRRRLLQTALAAWTSFRHTTVLVNEESGAECGEGGGRGTGVHASGEVVSSARDAPAMPHDVAAVSTPSAYFRAA